MQSLGCEVAALNTVQFSNHTGYRQFKGTRVSASEILDLWEGLKQSHLGDFDMMLSGYIPGAEAVEAVGKIARELNAKGSKDFFWVLDPVMGDNGNLYVAQDVVPAYKGLVEYADLILPNQFEAEVLSEVNIVDLPSLTKAVEVLHTRFGVPHIVITSVTLPHPDHPTKTMWVVGSTRTSSGKPRLFKIVFPAIDCYFSGTGDMFAALMVARMRQAVFGSPDHEKLKTQKSWVSDDAVEVSELPLAKAAEKVLATMHEILTKTSASMEVDMAKVKAALGSEPATDAEAAEYKRKMHLHKSKAAELRLVRNLDSLRFPKVELRAVPM
ncbi:hypothetical protein PpBr36_08649 [Pyricularia pennisetigena]|uniref:hypothetical protein n=1 Tax=Pyricularia pennisetigena TaxID=1578925 RepID=UPI00114DCC23|nr:hypothetical protein PpBr36_08649 [Pyricularia pennisetigena]TLS24777.1 hypothetical protein PpBr36_08649 [Pyricularia pennisetigena]